MADKQVSSSCQKPSYGHSFDTESYLHENFSPQKIDPTRLDFPLQGLHKFFGTRSHSGVVSGEMKILDYGCGPVPIYTISAATHASEIVFADYTEKNRRELQRWVEGDPQAFDWSHCFDYVVKTLEGGTGDQAKQREELVRRLVKGVVHCDMTQKCPIEKGYEGPYDIIITFLCLGCVETLEEFTAAVAKLVSLLKPGGETVMYFFEVFGCEIDGSRIIYTVGDEEFYCLHISGEFVKTTLEKNGLCDVTVSRYGEFIKSSNNKHYVRPVLYSARKAILYCY